MIWLSLMTAAVAANPTDTTNIKFIQPLEFEESFQYSWTAEQPRISSATIVVLHVSADKTGLPQVNAPVLYIGSTPAARTNPGRTDQHIVVYVPGHPDLSKTPIFWGPNELPERVTTEMGTHYAAQAIPTLPTPDLVHAVTQPLVRVANQGEMYGHIATMIERFAPGDSAFSHSIRVTIGQ